MAPLVPFAYHSQVRDLIQREEEGLWKWFESDKYEQEYGNSVRLELLKTTYRMEPQSHPIPYRAGARALEALELDVPLIFYQAQEVGQTNAGICFLPGEAHIIMSGPLQSTLSEDELTALVGHELAHYRLWTEEEGAFRISSQIVEAMASHAGAQPSHVNTAIRLRRYTEVYADRGAALTTDLYAAIACLVKVQTGLTQVDARAYLEQAEEILRRGPTTATGDEHPETFIRARALGLWHETPDVADEAITKMLHQLESLDDLDMLDQARLSELTRRLIGEVLQAKWMRTAPVLGQARLYFPDFDPVTAAPIVDGELEALCDAIRRYFAYVLLDFALVDSGLGDVAVGHTLRIAQAHGIERELEEAVIKEMNMTKRGLQALQAKLPSMLERVEQTSGAEP